MMNLLNESHLQSIPNSPLICTGFNIGHTIPNTWPFPLCYGPSPWDFAFWNLCVSRLAVQPCRHIMIPMIPYWRAYTPRINMLYIAGRRYSKQKYYMPQYFGDSYLDRGIYQSVIIWERTPNNTCASTFNKDIIVHTVLFTAQ